MKHIKLKINIFYIFNYILFITLMEKKINFWLVGLRIIHFNNNMIM